MNTRSLNPADPPRYPALTTAAGAVWPASTHLTATDVVIDEMSLLHLVQLCGTPCIHSAHAAVPGRGHRLYLRNAAVVVVQVTEVFPYPGTERVVLIDACLDGARPVWAGTRLIGRASSAVSTGAIILAGNTGETVPSGPLQLPADLSPGDLLAVPCRTGCPSRRLVSGHRPVREDLHRTGMGQ